MPVLEDVAGSAYGLLIADQLTQQRALKTSLEQRGIAVITTAGTLVTLLFGLAAFTTANKANPFHVLPLDTRLLFGLALVLFGAAIVLGVLTNRPSMSYNELAPKAFDLMLDEDAWRSSDTVLAAKRVAEAQAGIAVGASTANTQKAALLIWAFAAEVAAVIALGLAIGLVVLRG
jgi:hypothetical protein